MSLRYEKQVRRALDNAPSLESLKPENVYSSTKGDGLKAVSLDDADPVKFNFDRRVLKPQRNEIIIPRVDDFRHLHKTICALEDLQDTKEHRDHVEEVIRHEGEHGFIAKALGARAVAYGLKLWRYGEDIADIGSTKVYRLPTVKLGVALLLAYPTKPSQGDLMTIQAYGYEGGVPEVGRRIELYNENVPSKDNLPLPLSYKRKRSRGH